jgi:hypothetical protein
MQRQLLPCTLSSLVLTVCVLPMVAQRPVTGCDEGVQLQIVTDRASYSPGATMHVKFLLANTGEQPLYLLRPVVQCSSPLGSFHLEILASNGKALRQLMCSSDTIMLDTEKVIGELNSPMYGVRLAQNEIYGIETDYVLPKKKGSYKIVAQLFHMGYFTDELRAALRERHMKVPQNNCPAPTVTIMVK